MCAEALAEAHENAVAHVVVTEHAHPFNRKRNRLHPHRAPTGGVTLSQAWVYFRGLRGYGMGQTVGMHSFNFFLCCCRNEVQSCKFARTYEHGFV